MITLASIHNPTAAKMLKKAAPKGTGLAGVNGEKRFLKQKETMSVGINRESE